MAEVCSLSRPVTFKPVSVPLQNGLRFLRLPLPASLSAFLAVGLPVFRQEYGLTLFRVGDMGGLGPAFSPVAALSTIPDVIAGIPGHVPFWPEPVSAFGSLLVTTFSSGSLSLAIPPSLGPWACALAPVSYYLAVSDSPLRAGYLCFRGFARGDCSPRTPG